MKKDINHNIIKEYRLRANLSQSKLACIIGVTQSCISRWENRHAYPLVETAKNLSKTLHIPFELIYEKKIPTTQFSIPVYESVGTDGTGRNLCKSAPSIILTEEYIRFMTPSRGKSKASSVSGEKPGKGSGRKDDSVLFFGFCSRAGSTSSKQMEPVHILYRTNSILSDGIYLVSINCEDCILARISNFKDGLVVSEVAKTQLKLYRHAAIRDGVFRIHGVLVEKREMYMY